MKRVKTPLFAIAAIVLLGSCRSPVLSGGAGTVRMSVAIPESVGSASRSTAASAAAARYIDPAGGYLVATVSIAGSDRAYESTCVVPEGASEAALEFADLPLGVMTTLRIYLYDSEYKEFLRGRYVGELTLPFAGGTVEKNITLQGIPAMEVMGYKFYLESYDGESKQLLSSGDSIYCGQIGDKAEVHPMSFTVNNNGTGELVISACTIVKTSGEGSFSVTVPPASTVPANGSTTFTVTYAATTGAHPDDRAILTLGTNDQDNGEFTLSFSGTASY